MSRTMWQFTGYRAALSLGRECFPSPACHFFPFIFGRNLGTVGAVALDSEGNVAYATSTGGIVNKMAGRVGDTPCIGSLGHAHGPRCPSPAVRFSISVLYPSLLPSPFWWQFQSFWERQSDWKDFSGILL